MQTTWNLEQKLISLLYQQTRSYKKPIKLDLKQLSRNLDAQPDAIRQALNRLLKKGYIKRSDKYGNKANHTASPEKRLVKLVMDNGCLPWDRRHRYGIAKRLGLKLSSLRRVKYNLEHLLHTEYDARTNWPTEIRVISEAEALAFLDDQPINHHSIRGRTYWKYVKGWKNPDRKKKNTPAPKPPKVLLKHRILLYLLNSGGTVQGGTCVHIKHLNCNRRTYERSIKRLVNDGMVTKSTNGVCIRDAHAAAIFLAPIGLRPTKAIAIKSLSPPTSSSAVAVSNGLKMNQLPSVTVYQSSFPPSFPSHTKKTTGRVEMMLFSLLVKQRLAYEIGRMMVQYPEKYEKGQARILENRRQYREIDDEAAEAHRQRSGRMFGKQKGICSDILSRIQVYMKLGGVILEPLLEETAHRIVWALPTLDCEDRDTAEQLVEWLDLVLPLDRDDVGWVQSFITHSKSSTISEFVCRGGVDLLFRMKAWMDAETGVVDQRIAWDIMCYLSHVELHPFHPRYAEMFPNITSWDGLQTEESYINGATVARSLRMYFELDYKLGSIYQLKHMICKALIERFPRKGEDGIEIVSVWDEEQTHDLLGGYDEYDVLCEWMEEYESEVKAVQQVTIPKFSLMWYETKLRGIEKYGLPGDVEAVNLKVASLKRWSKATTEEQKTKLVHILNAVTRYDNPQLDWAAWDRIARQ